MKILSELVGLILGSLYILFFLIIKLGDSTNTITFDGTTSSFIIVFAPTITLSPIILLPIMLEPAHIQTF